MATATDQTKLRKLEESKKAHDSFSAKAGAYATGEAIVKQPPKVAKKAARYR